MEFLDRLGTEWSAISGSPISFAGALIVVAVLIWGALNWRYSSIIDGLKERLSLRDEKLDEYKRKLEGATPEEAQARIAELEAALASLRPRSLSDGQRTLLREGLSQTGWERARVVWHGSNGEPEGYAREIGRCFSGVGIETTVDTLGPFITSAWGLMAVKNKSGAHEQLHQVFTAAGVPLDVAEGGDSLGKSDVPLILVGNRE